MHFELPSDRAVPMAVNRGKPVALAEPGADFSKAVKHLADMIAGSRPAAGKAGNKQKQSRQSIMSKLRS